MDERFGLRVPATLLRWARRAAAAERRSLSNLIRNALENYLIERHPGLEHEDAEQA